MVNNKPFPIVIHACTIVGIDKGTLLLAECDETHPEILCWSVYLVKISLLEWVSDHKTKIGAQRKVKRMLKKGGTT